MRNDVRVPLEPDEAVFQHDGKAFALIRKEGKEYASALILFENGHYYKVMNDLRYFPAHMIAGKSEQCEIARAYQLEGYVREA